MAFRTQTRTPREAAAQVLRATSMVLKGDLAKHECGGPGGRGAGPAGRDQRAARSEWRPDVRPSGRRCGVGADRGRSNASSRVPNGADEPRDLSRARPLRKAAPDNARTKNATTSTLTNVWSMTLPPLRLDTAASAMELDLKQQDV